MFSFTDAELQRWLGMVIWPFFRLLAFIGTAPFFSHPMILGRVKIGLAGLMAFLIAPSISSPGIELFSGAGILTLLQQILIGASLGFSLRIIFSLFELAGDLIGLQMGLGFASFLDPQRNAPSPILGTLLLQIAILVFLASNAHLTLLATLCESFRILPASPLQTNTLNSMKLANLGSLVFSMGLQIALPVLAATLAINLGLGILSRSAPQLNLFSLGFAITLIAGMLAIFLSLGVMVGPMQNITQMIVLPWD